MINIIERIKIAAAAKQTYFNLSRMGLQIIPEEIGELTFLEELILDRNQIKKIPSQIGRLTNLKRLRLNKNNLESLPKEIGFLSNLEELDLSSNNLDRIPDEFGNLNNLLKLSLQDNEFDNFPDVLSKLGQLEVLDLGDNRLSQLPEVIRNLSRLKKLNLTNNSISQLSSSIGGLKELELLSLKNNCLVSIPEEVYSLTKLEALYLSSNFLKSLPDGIQKLLNLTVLDLSKNRIKILKKDIGSLHNLKTIGLIGNQIQFPPIQITTKGVDAIRNFLNRLELEKDSFLFEIKLVVVGQGAVGKTSLVDALIDGNKQLDPELDSTHGILIKNLFIDCEIRGQIERIKVNIWDFGGQEIYHSTHQFFLSKRSIYLLVGDTRKENDNFDYWLNLIDLLGKGSPTMMVINKTDLRSRELDEIGYKNKYSNIHSYHKVSCKDHRGISELHFQIKMALASLDHLGDMIPGVWLDIRTHLEKENRNFISYKEYLSICEEYDLDMIEADTLSEYLHDIGVILHFNKNKTLRDFVILKPGWGTKAIYQILDPDIAPIFIRKNKGRFNFDDLKKLWSKNPDYPYQTHEKLLELMLKFELAFQFSDTNKYIVPQLLSYEVPKFKFPDDKIVKIVQDQSLKGIIKSDLSILKFQYYYDFLPKGIITRFICRIHKQIEKDHFWRNGVILSFENTQAKVFANQQDNLIKIEIVGIEKKALLFIIRHHFQHIHSTFSNLQYQEMIPCICSVCNHSKSPTYFDFSMLKKRRRSYIECRESEENIPIRSLLSGVKEAFSIKYLKKMITKNRYPEVFEILKDFNQYESQVNLIQARLNTLESNFRIGLLDNKEYYLENNKIRKSILAIVEEISNEDIIYR